MTTPAFVRLEVLVDGERCAEGCPALTETDDGDPICGAFNRSLDYEDNPRRLPQCIAATTQQALDDAVLEQAEVVETWATDFSAGAPGPVEFLAERVRARRKGTP